MLFRETAPISPAASSAASEIVRGRHDLDASRSIRRSAARIGTLMTASTTTARLPPGWFIRLFWFGHRWLYLLSRSRFGLWKPKPNKYGVARLTTLGQRTGIDRSVMFGYFAKMGAASSRWR